MHLLSGTSVTAMLTLMLALPQCIDAAGCRNTGPVCGKLCGKVVNNSKWKAKYADLGTSDDLCHVYNWNGGKGSVGWSEKRVKCAQHDLPVGATRGGRDNNVDVDGITFADRRWRIIWEGGQSYDFAAGVWAKIASGEAVTCTTNADGRVPECRVKCTCDIDIPGVGSSCVGK